MKLVLRQFLNCQGRSLQRGVQVHVDDCPLLTRFYVIAGFTLMSSQGALRAAPRTAREVVRCAGDVSWLNILMDQSLLVSRSQATATCALCRHAASEALPELGSTAPAWRPAECAPSCAENWSSSVFVWCLLIRDFDFSSSTPRDHSFCSEPSKNIYFFQRN